MNKIKVNKKGDPALNMLMAVGILGGLLLLYFLVILPSINSGSKGLGDILKSGDFDGDSPAGSTDVMDPCPCGVNNDKVPFQADSTAYCVASYTDQACKEINVFANKMYKEDTNGKKDQKFFFYDAKLGCLYSMKGCQYYIMYNKV